MDSEIEAEVEELYETGLVIDPTLLVWQRYSGILDNAMRHDERRKWVHPEACCRRGPASLEQS